MLASRPKWQTDEVALWIGLLVLWLSFIYNSTSRLAWVCEAALALGFCAWAAWRARRDPQPWRGPQALVAGLQFTLLGFAAGLMVYARVSDFPGMILRGNMATYHAPVYGRGALASLGGGLAVLFCGSCLVALIVRDAAESRRLSALVAALHLSILGSLFAARFEFGDLGSLRGTSLFRFRELAEHFDHPLGLLRNYVGAIPDLPTAAAHYPPGLPFLYRLSLDLGAEWLPLALIWGCAVVMILPLWGLLKRLGSAPDSLAVHALLVASMCCLALPSTAATTIQGLLACTCLWLLARVLSGPGGGWWESLAIGALMVLFSFLSLTVVFFGLQLALISLLAWRWGGTELRRVVRVAFLSLGCYGSILLVIQLTTGFDLFACARATTASHSASRAQWLTSWSWLYYVVVSSGNLLSFAVGCGLPLSAVALLGLRRLPSLAPMPRAFAWGGVGSLVIACWATPFHLELERIFTFFLPAMFVVGSAQLEAWRGDDRLDRKVAAVALVFALGQVLVFQHWL